MPVVPSPLQSPATSDLWIAIMFTAIKSISWYLRLLLRLLCCARTKDIAHHTVDVNEGVRKEAFPYYLKRLEYLTESTEGSKVVEPHELGMRV